jgi:regulator of cell morphogenesis and NO signaling
METLDVTQIDIRLKHPTIFKRFDALPEGEEFIINNDHDPKPLYYQLLAERGETFGWEYIEQGPLNWKVKLTKKAAKQEASIGELVAKDFRKAEVFKKYGLDFCCGGKKTVTEACREKDIDQNLIVQELADIDNNHSGGAFNYASWNLDFLADYIVSTHHKYVATSIPFLYEMTLKVASAHGENHPEVLEIAEHFREVAQELTMHMKKEEMILFPYIKQLAIAEREHSLVEMPPFGSVENPIRMMEEEHVSAGNGLEDIEELSNGFVPPEDACASYRVLYAKLKEFQDDLHQHIHLENNILFPKAILLEEQLLTSH